MTGHELPRIGAPAIRALAAHDVTTLDGCTAVTRSELASWHGVGPKAVRLLDEALAEAGLGWRPES